jgi:hypothetical protein
MRNTLRQLLQVMQELQALIKEDKRLFNKSYLPACVKDRAQKLFQGEKEKMIEYRDMISSLLLLDSHSPNMEA